MPWLYIVLFTVCYTYFIMMFACYLVRRSEIANIKLHALPKSGKTRVYLNNRKDKLSKVMLKHVLLWPIYAFSNDKKA